VCARPQVAHVEESTGYRVCRRAIFGAGKDGGNARAAASTSAAIRGLRRAGMVGGGESSQSPNTRSRAGRRPRLSGPVRGTGGRVVGSTGANPAGTTVPRRSFSGTGRARGACHPLDSRSVLSCGRGGRRGHGGGSISIATGDVMGHRVRSPLLRGLFSAGQRQDPAEQTAAESSG